ncbi:MAG TPA: hypothetical protein VFO16_06800 [Pseudonocardiaceae bacterium]|nr:hypothetical protein [Pseudonocardiaceae bacterium]
MSRLLASHSSKYCPALQRRTLMPPLIFAFTLSISARASFSEEKPPRAT